MSASGINRNEFLKIIFYGALGVILPVRACFVPPAVTPTSSVPLTLPFSLPFVLGQAKVDKRKEVFLPTVHK